MAINKFDINERIYAMNITLDDLNRLDGRPAVIIATKDIDGVPMFPIGFGIYSGTSPDGSCIRITNCKFLYNSNQDACTKFFRISDFAANDGIYSLIYCATHLDLKTIENGIVGLTQKYSFGGYVVKFPQMDHTSDTKDIDHLLNNPFVKQTLKYEFDMDKLMVGGAYHVTFLENTTIFNDTFNEGDNINVLLSEKYPDRLICVRLVNTTNQFGRVYAEAFVIDTNMKIKLECLDVAIPT